MIMDRYVFYDKNGNIKIIASSLDDVKNDEYSAIKLPLSEVEPFLQGKKNSFDYVIRKVKSSGNEKFVLIKRVSNVIYTRTLDNYLTEISNKKNNTTAITIVNQPRRNSFLVEFTSVFRSMLDSDIEEERDIIDNILRTPKTSIYITKKHNPYYLLMTITFSPKELFTTGKMYFKYEGKIENTSAYTKRIVDEYYYKE